jgi:hypothetical protein
MMNNTLIQGHVAEWEDDMKTATANATTTTTTTATAKIPRQKIFHVSALFFYVIGPRHLAFIVQYLVHSS